jgi:hypothetical protein
MEETSMLERLCQLFCMYALISVAGATYAQTGVPSTNGTKSPYPPLSTFNIKNYVPGINYPDWFGSPSLPSGVRGDLVTLYNRKEWLIFSTELDEATTSRLQPLLDALGAVAAASDPAERLTRDYTRTEPVKNRDKSKDAPSDAETPGPYADEIRVLNAEMRYVFRLYHIPPSLAEGTPSVTENPRPANAPPKTSTVCNWQAMSRQCDENYASCTKPCVAASTTTEYKNCMEACNRTYDMCQGEWKACFDRGMQ